MEKEKKNQDFLKKYSNWLIPILALLVIFQAVALFSQPSYQPVSTGFIPVPEKNQPLKEASVSLSFIPSGASLEQGQTSSFDLVLTPKRPLRLDGADVVLEFNPQVLQLAQITTPKLFSVVSQKKENESEGKLYVTFLEEKPGGVFIDKEVKLLTLSFKGKEKGQGTVSLISTDQGPSTVITESGTSKKILFEKNSLKVVVY